MNIKFIKWMVGYAEGFDWKEQEGHLFITAPDGMKRTFILWTDFSNWHKVYFPLLLQRAIEGINKGNTGYWLIFEMNNIEVYSNWGLCDGWMRVNIDESKEQALEYVYEQENNR